MSSRIDTINEIAVELNSYIKLTKDESTIKAFERILDRLIEARNYFEMGEDYTGQKCTSRMIGSYLMKTWRMTTSKDFNKLIIKKMPAHYRKITETFGKINEFSEEILGYDYKQVKAAEDQAQNVIPFIQQAEKSFKLAGEREKDLEKSDFLTSVAIDFQKLLSLVFIGKDEKGALVSTKEVKDRTGEIWSRIQDIEWDEYITDDLHNPTFALKEVSDKFPSIMDPYMEKKFVPKKERVAKEASSEMMKEDVVHLEFDRSKRKAPLQKRGTLAARKGALGAKKGAKKVTRLGEKKKAGKGVLARKSRTGSGFLTESEFLAEDEAYLNAAQEIEDDEMEDSDEITESEFDFEDEDLNSEDEEIEEQVDPEIRPLPLVKRPSPSFSSGRTILQGGGTLKSGGLKPAGGRTWLTVNGSNDDEEPLQVSVKTQASPDPPPAESLQKPVGSPAAETIAPHTEMKPPEAIVNNNSFSAPKAFEPIKEKHIDDEELEEKYKVVKREDLEEEFDDKKKGCLPFVAGISGFIILLIYAAVHFR